MKVYSSSTYQDLAEHRAAVDRTLRRMGHDVIGMEQYVTGGNKPIERSKADVRAADAYVIIVGGVTVSSQRTGDQSRRKDATARTLGGRTVGWTLHPR